MFHSLVYTRVYPFASTRGQLQISLKVFLLTYWVFESLFSWKKCIEKECDSLGKEGNLGAHVMKCVALGVHLPTPWLF